MRKPLFPTWPLTFLILLTYAVMLGDAIAAEEPLYITACVVGIALSLRLLLRGL